MHILLDRTTQRLFSPGLIVRIDPVLDVRHGQLAVDLLSGCPGQPERDLLLGRERLGSSHPTRPCSILAVATLAISLDDLAGLAGVTRGGLLQGVLLGLQGGAARGNQVAVLGHLSETGDCVMRMVM